MEAVIANLVRQFERGGLTRRQLIQGLALLASAGAASPAAAQAGSLQGTGIDHVSILVSDLQHSAMFYQSLFGLTPISEDKPNQIFRLGTTRTLVSLRHEGEPGRVDHFGIKVDNFDKTAVTARLKEHGLTPQENVQFGFHVKDPDGTVVQIV
jgi:catechol-2,3-dioxygenase